MLSEKEILVALVSTGIVVGFSIAIIKRLSDRMLTLLDQTLLDLKNNDTKLSNRVTEIEKCNVGTKKDIERNVKDINDLRVDLRRCKEKHAS